MIQTELNRFYFPSNNCTGTFVWQARHYDLESNNPDGCAPCNCDPGASTSLECPADTGMCTCMENIGGRDCRTPSSGNYVPKLDAMTYDAEFAFNATVSDFQSKSEIFSIGGFREREILSISCSFWGNFGTIVCWRPPGELAPPPRGNPGSATVISAYVFICPFFITVVLKAYMRSFCQNPNRYAAQ